MLGRPDATRSPQFDVLELARSGRAQSPIPMKKQAFYSCEVSTVPFNFALIFPTNRSFQPALVWGRPERFDDAYLTVVTKSTGTSLLSGGPVGIVLCLSKRWHSVCWEGSVTQSRIENEIERLRNAHNTRKQIDASFACQLFTSNATLGAFGCEAG